MSDFEERADRFKLNQQDIVVDVSQQRERIVRLRSALRKALDIIVRLSEGKHLTAADSEAIRNIFEELQ